jgi:hypothetical protein
MAKAQTKNRLFAMLSEPIADSNRTNPTEDRTNPPEQSESILSTGPIWRPTPCWSDVPEGAVPPDGADVWVQPDGSRWARFRTAEDMESLKGIAESFNDQLFPPPAPPAPVTMNLTARELGERVGASALRYGVARDRWRNLSRLADTTLAESKTLDGRIVKGIAFIEQQRVIVASGAAMAEKVKADALLQEATSLLGRLRDQRHDVGENLARIEADMDRVAVEMGEAEDAIRRALGNARGYCCNKCGGWVSDLPAHEEGGCR